MEEVSHKGGRSSRKVWESLSKFPNDTLPDNLYLFHMWRINVEWYQDSHITYTYTVEFQ